MMRKSSYFRKVKTLTVELLGRDVKGDLAFVDAATEVLWNQKSGPNKAAQAIAKFLDPAIGQPSISSELRQPRRDCGRRIVRKSEPLAG